MTIDAFADFRLTDHKVIITGGAQNIGAGIARLFSAAGADVLIADLKGELAHETAAQIAAETGGRCIGIACDVTKDRLNTISAYRMSAACVPHMAGFHNAAIVTSGSFSSAIPASEILAYSTAKAALNHLMACLANALAKKVRVNSVLIGTVLTDGYASAGIDPDTQKRMEHPDTLTGRPGRPQDVANAMLWLASPAASWVSGQTINVQGGGHVVRLFGH